MKKYTIEELKKYNIVIECKNAEEFNKLIDITQAGHNYTFISGHECFRFTEDSFLRSSKKHYVHENFLIISFDQVIFPEDEFVLPEKWYINNEEACNNKILLVNWLNLNKTTTSKYDLYAFNNGLGLAYPSYQYSHLFIHLPNGYTEITFEQFKKHVLKETTMEKKIIGYKLVKPEYTEAAVKIEGNRTIGLAIRNGEQLVDREEGINKLRTAGVLDLWFEPVYEELFKVGDWVIGWHCENFKKHEAWQVSLVEDRYVYVKGTDGYSTTVEHVRKATTEEIEKATTIKIAGYKAEFKSDERGPYVKFGCKEIDKVTVEELYNLFNKGIALTVTISGEEITKDLVQKILSKF